MRIIGFFCEDVRREQAKIESIVGVLPDVLLIGEVPGMIPKLAIYVRVQIDLDEPAEAIELKFHMPNGEVHSAGGADKSLVEKSQNAARNENLPFGGIVLRGSLSPFFVESYGLITLGAIVAGEERLCAVLKLKSPVTSTASPPPVAQSPAAAPGSPSPP